MPLNIESDAAGGCRVIAEKLAGYLRTVRGLELSALDAYLA